MDEELFIGPRGFPPLDNNPKLGDYVLVEFNTDPKVYYVEKIITEMDGNNDFVITYMRKQEKMDTFTFPNVPDEASVSLEDIKVILSDPVKCGTTRRQLSFIKFEYSFSNLLVK